MKYFDPENKQLIYISQESTSHFWDGFWCDFSALPAEFLTLNNTFVSRITKKYVGPTDGVVLEGGCGMGQYVASLVNSGYNTIGVDYARNTLNELKHCAPSYDLVAGDVRTLPFLDNSFVAYWSLGVIEHFWAGYYDIASEMYRVLKDGGYLFVTFPYMSPLRVKRVRRGLYQPWLDRLAPKGFHQFALNSELVIRNFSGLGFELIETIPHDAATGMEDELRPSRFFLQKLLDFAPHHRFVGFLETIFEKLFAHFSGHCMLLVMRKGAQVLRI